MERSRFRLRRGQAKIVERTGLSFEQMAVQAKLLALNKQNIWKGAVI